jgi:biopolymer transport protein ExbB
MLPEDLGADSDLLLAGGWVMVAILALSLLMWMLILDRYLYLWRERRALVARCVERWQAGHGADQIANHRLRVALRETFRESLGARLGVIQVITAILPLLGLLGTVTGMIRTFEVMTAFGTGNVRGMADGISQALITTMAGLMTALAGMYFAGDLHERIERDTDHFSGQLDGALPERGGSER